MHVKSLNNCQGRLKDLNRQWVKRMFIIVPFVVMMETNLLPNDANNIQVAPWPLVKIDYYRASTP